MGKRALFVASLVCGGLGCTASVGGKFVHPGEYDHGLFPVRVGYGPQDQGILGSDWLVDNFTATKDRPGPAKSGPGYVLVAHYDMDDDGKEDRTREEPIRDVLFLHRRTGASMWVTLTTLSTREEDLDLSELAEEVIERVAGGASTMQLDSPGADSRGVVRVVEHRTAVAELASAACRLGTDPAYEVDFELADVDRLKLDPTSRSAKVRLVIARTPYRDRVARSAAYNSKAPTLPVILIAALRARPERFDSHLADFAKLMEQVGMGAKDDHTPPTQASGFRCDAAVKRAAPSVEPPAPAAASTAPAPMAPQQAPPPAAEPKDNPAGAITR